MFGGQKKTIGQALRKVAPDLDAKKRAKYAPVVRFLVAKMPPGGNVKAFVRKNDGLNGCVAKEKICVSADTAKAESVQMGPLRCWQVFSALCRK